MTFFSVERPKFQTHKTRNQKTQNFHFIKDDQVNFWRGTGFFSSRLARIRQKSFRKQAGIPSLHIIRLPIYRQTKASCNLLPTQNPPERAFFFKDSDFRYAGEFYRPSLCDTMAACRFIQKMDRGVALRRKARAKV